MSLAPVVHPNAVSGFQDASLYDKFRVDYTNEAVQYVLNLCGLRSNGSSTEAHAPAVLYDIVELGAGTGKFTTCAAMLLRGSIRYLATDPSEPFLRKLIQQNPHVAAELAPATQIPVKAKGVAAVVCAQAFHWFATKEAVSEIFRVLMKGGSLVLIWNTRAYTHCPWLKTVDDFLATLYEEQGSPYQKSQKWAKIFTGDNRFTKLENTTVSGPTKIFKSADEVKSYYSTISVIANLDPKRKAKSLEWIASQFPDGKWSIPFVCEITYCYKK